MALIQGHGGVGIVEAVGPDVRRVQVGDRVCVSGTPQCGACYQCLRGRADMCQFLGRQGPDDLVPIADMSDGTPVYANSLIGGLAEKMVTFEEWVVPIFTKATAADLGMVCSCVSVAGLGATTSQNVALVDRIHRRRRRVRAARVERGPGRPHFRRVHDHRDRSDSRPPRGALESRRHARARSQRGRHSTRGHGTRALERTEQSTLGRRTRCGRPPRRRRCRLRDRSGWRGCCRAEARSRARPDRHSAFAPGL